MKHHKRHPQADEAAQAQPLPSQSAPSPQDTQAQATQGPDPLKERLEALQKRA